MEIQLKINDTLLADLGTLYVKQFLEKQLQLLELQLSANKVNKAMQDQKDVNWEKEFDKARKEAWNEYENKFLNTDM